MNSEDSPKTVMEVECEISDDLYSKVASVGKDLASEEDFFNIGCRIILEEAFPGQASQEDTEE